MLVYSVTETVDIVHKVAEANKQCTQYCTCLVTYRSPSVA